MTEKQAKQIYIWGCISAFCIVTLICSAFDKPEEENVKYLQTVEYEGCEYVLYGGAAGGICHKGNCKNPAHND